MKFIYSALLAGVLLSGLYLYLQFQRHVDKSISKTEMRYLTCIEQGKDSQQCVMEEMNLRALTTCPK